MDKKENDVPEERIRLNRFIANAGVCSRREADTLIENGEIKVNGEVVTEMGHKVLRSDAVTYNDRQIRSERPVYILMNKPKGFITTMKDTHDRKTVMDIIDKACKERVYPVGRLDKETTGVLMFTNDGDLAKKLTHPSHEVRKLYHVTLNKEVTEQHLKDLMNGIVLDDGLTKADEVAFVEKAADKTEVGIAIHSGKKRIVRRLFIHLGYEVMKLDRVLFADLTKKDLSRGQWRFLTKAEIDGLKRLSN